MTIIESLNSAVGTCNSYLWGMAFVFLIGLGILFTFKLKGLQITKIKETSKLSVSGITEGKKNSKVSSFEAFCIGMGARIGVGNIAGVATAILTGGPGAVFWMWIFAIIGSASSFMESTLAQIYKEKKEDGQFYGGPAYYASKGLKSRKVGIFAAILLVITFGIGFVAVQSCNASKALCGAFSFEYNNYIFAAIIAIVAAILIFRGLKAVAKFSSTVVPIMAFLWIIFAIIAIVLNIDGVVNAVKMIFEYAFTAPSMLGGALGSILITGLKRGVFSNEAGLGSVANIAATADVKHPVKQGMIQSFGVLVDTLIVCTFTALVVLSYGTFDQILALGAITGDGANLVQGIIADTAFGSAANYIIAIFLFSKRADYKAIGKLSVAPAIFEINECMTFGLPIVLNPYLVIPFIITPLITGTIGYFATVSGFAGVALYAMPWTTPPIISAWLSTGGSIGAVITQIICIAVSVAIYTPFVFLANKEPVEEEAAA